MIKKKTLTPVFLAGVFLLMLGLSFAAVPLYDMFCRITGFGGTTQVSKEAPKIAKAVKIFFLLVFLSGIIIIFYLSKK